MILRDYQSKAIADISAALAATNEFIDYNTDFRFYYACPSKMFQAAECAYPAERVIAQQGRRSFLPEFTKNYQP